MAPFIVYDGSYEVDLPPFVPASAPGMPPQREITRVISLPTIEIEYDGSYETFVDLPAPESPRLVSTRNLGAYFHALRI